jgi:hypothetical protein
MAKENWPMSRTLAPAAVECYAGHKGEETPRAVALGGKRLEVVAILSRERILDAPSGPTRQVWRCRLDNGRTVTVELLEDGAWRVSSAD